jgi:NADH:ubiquinone oxidoreductase subunit 6 (subunit J)
MESMMTYQDDDRRVDRARRNSPVGWAIGAIFVIAVVAAVFFYNGRDVGPQTTTTSPTNAPSVTTGSTNPAAPAK